MTGSLGCYYHSAQAAARASHAKCNCLIVPKIGNRSPEIDGYDPDALYMHWIKSVKEEGMRPEHELSESRKRKNRLHRDGWETANPVETICSLLPMAKRDSRRESGSKKIIWKSDYSSVLVLIDPMGGYFRIIDKNRNKKKGAFPFLRFDGTRLDDSCSIDYLEQRTHFKIAGFDGA